MVVDQDLYVNTYSGIFKNGVKILPNFSNVDGMLHDKSNNSIFFSNVENLINLNLENNKVVIENYVDKVGEPYYI